MGLHAIQDGLLFLTSTDWVPGHLVVFADN